MPLPVLYILMRDDFASMNSGKAMAQASHASNAFVEYMKGTMLETDRGLECEHDCNRWQGFCDDNGNYNPNGLGFGTVLVLAVNGKTMYERVALGQALGFHAGIVNDPTYPLRDGEVTHYIPLDTCAWIFTPDKDLPLFKMVVGDLPLHP